MLEAVILFEQMIGPLPKNPEDLQACLQSSPWVMSGLGAVNSTFHIKLLT